MAFRTLAASLLILAAPAAAQSTGCVRGPLGTLECGVLGTAQAGSPPPRATVRRDLSAGAVARSKDQAAALAGETERLRAQADGLEAGRRAAQCGAAIGSLPAEPSVTCPAKP